MKFKSKKNIPVGVGAPETLAKSSTLSSALTAVEGDLSRIFGAACSPVISNATSLFISAKAFLTRHFTIPASPSVILLI